MKKSHIFLFIIFMFIISCGNKVTAPSVSDITYYDPNEAIIKTYPYNLYDKACTGPKWLLPPKAGCERLPSQT